MVINSILLLLALNCHRWEKTTATPSGRKKKHIRRQIVMKKAFGSKMILEDVDNCIEIYHLLRLGAKPSSSMPKYFIIDPAYSESD
jgi:hypothetical protein